MHYIHSSICSSNLLLLKSFVFPGKLLGGQRAPYLFERRVAAPLNMPLKPESGPVCDLHGSVWDEGALLLLLRLHEV